MSIDLIIEIAGFITGILYLWYEYHANPRLWPVSVIMPAISMYIYYSRGLYADFGINIYYMGIALYGYMHWTHSGKKHPEESSKGKRDISHTPCWGWIVAISALALSWTALWYFLSHFTDSSVPVADAFTTAFSIVATWMLARKWAEQWLAWLIIDIVCVGLYIYKGIYFYATLYTIYTFIALIGYRKWCSMIPVKKA